MVKSVESRKPNAALLEAKRRAKNLKMLEQEQIVEPVKDVFSKALSSLKMVRSETGIIYDDSMDQHKCFWDEEHQERPERFTEIIKRCQELDLLDKSTSGVTDQEHLEDTSSNYNAIYIHPSTFDLSLLSAGCTIDLVDNIIKKKVQNGMAIIRPPGHHAMKAEFNGYCFFNNVAIAARHALDVLNLKKILIIDWDAHHGQGTQRFFYDDPRVLYFSLHRYEFGEFWPNLRESDYDWIGEGSGKGFNFNIPLNKKFMQNEDYLSVFQQILLPVAFEFQPELVIVSAGYDAAFGCPEGEMALTPAFYSHMTRSLMHLADGKLAIVLEGGYCVRSLAEGATLTLRALLDFPSPTLVDKWEVPSPEICETILNCIYVHRPYWKCLNVQDTYTLEELNNKNPQPDLHKVVQVYKGKLYLKKTTDLECSKNKLCYVYDDKMCEHKNVDEEGHPECPERIKKIKSKFEEFGLTQRMQLLPSRIATTDEVCLAHTRLHLNFVRRLTPKANLKEIGSKFNSVYLHEKTFDCATLAAGSVLNVVDNILTNQFRSGVCVIRPPGHHAEPDQPHGFCIFNNVAIAAQYAIRNGVNKVLIVDWDVHHGNGTQHIFENNPNVLYISIHRYDNATFFPKKTDANYDVVGKGAGEGFNVNIPWNKKGMTDMEYIMVMQQIVLPIAYEFNPELVLVSAGFDAAIGDPLGG
uniref:Histone deacetylase domain-containing protein n=1 Tax=Megaselia scalaris TaxID=36166 RepID=T1GQY7_MEGSC